MARRARRKSVRIVLGRQSFTDDSFSNRSEQVKIPRIFRPGSGVTFCTGERTVSSIVLLSKFAVAQPNISDPGAPFRPTRRGISQRAIMP
ncbi:MAG: hypothetical protein ABI728_09725 [Betaproteobacteria bacterium]